MRNFVLAAILGLGATFAATSDARADHYHGGGWSRGSYSYHSPGYHTTYRYSDYGHGGHYHHHHHHHVLPRVYYPPRPTCGYGGYGGYYGGYGGHSVILHSGGVVVGYGW